MNFQQFVKQGYLILRQNCLETSLESTELERFHQNIVFFHKTMRKFFERPSQERLLFKSDQPQDLRVSGYRCGYWPKDIYKDEYEGKKFPLEYYHSRNFYSNKGDNFLIPENKLEPSWKDNVDQLPHKQGYEIAGFIDRHILKPLVEHLTIYLPSNKLPSFILQLGATYYRDQVMLDIHRDKGFIQNIIGPASGLRIQPTNSATPQPLTLDMGEILIYTGFQFQEYFAGIPAVDKVEPLLHEVIGGEDKRMSIVAAAFLKT
jgi:hypothetical protein